MTEKKKTERELLEEISSKLDKLIYAISLQGKAPEEKVKLLIERNHKNKQISQLAGLSVVKVQNIRQKLKKKRSKTKTK